MLANVAELGAGRIMQSYRACRAFSQLGCDLVQLIVQRSTFRAFLVRQHDIGNLHCGRLTRQGKHLVHGDPSSDRCITQARLANRFLPALREAIPGAGLIHPARLELREVPRCVSKAGINLGGVKSNSFSVFGDLVGTGELLPAN